MSESKKLINLTSLPNNDIGALRLKRVLRPPGAAAFLGLAESTLAKMRLTGTGPKYVQLSPRAVGYTIESLVEHVDVGRRKSTSDSGDAQ